MVVGSTQTRSHRHLVTIHPLQEGKHYLPNADWVVRNKFEVFLAPGVDASVLSLGRVGECSRRNDVVTTLHRSEQAEQACDGVRS